MFTQIFNFKNNDVVSFDYNELKGEGFIRGCATSPQPPIGGSYIIEITNSNGNLPNDVYPFKFISVPECYINLKST